MTCCGSLSLSGFLSVCSVVSFAVLCCCCLLLFALCCVCCLVCVLLCVLCVRVCCYVVVLCSVLYLLFYILYWCWCSLLSCFSMFGVVCACVVYMCSCVCGAMPVVAVTFFVVGEVFMPLSVYMCLCLCNVVVCCSIV